MTKLETFWKQGCTKGRNYAGAKGFVGAKLIFVRLGLNVTNPNMMKLLLHTVGERKRPV